MSKRLFLFAGYDKNGTIDNALILYIRALSKLGDVIFVGDSDFSSRELSKIKDYTIYAWGRRHGEYDFGSYKRAYLYAQDNDLLQKYDYIYLANDSVYGPLIDMRKTIKKIESIKTDAAGMVVARHKTHAYMESWFVRLNKKICTSDWFAEFISKIKNQPSKTQVTIEYEHGLSKLLTQNKCSWTGVYNVRGRYTYNHPRELFNKGCPFIKKNTFCRHYGALGCQIKYILKHCDKTASDIIIQSANASYGSEYISWLLTCNPIKTLIRNIKYASNKIKNGGI